MTPADLPRALTEEQVRLRLRRLQSPDPAALGILFFGYSIYVAIGLLNESTKLVFWGGLSVLAAILIVPCVAWIRNRSERNCSREEIERRYTVALDKAVKSGATFATCGWMATGLAVVLLGQSMWYARSLIPIQQAGDLVGMAQAVMGLTLGAAFLYMGRVVHRRRVAEQREWSASMHIGLAPPDPQPVPVPEGNTKP
jgi:hypothetical protein